MAYGGHVFYHFFTLFPTYMVYSTTFLQNVKSFFPNFLTIVCYNKGMKKTLKNAIKKALIRAISISIITPLLSCSSNPNSTLNHSMKDVAGSKKNVGRIDKTFGDENKDVVVFSTNDSMGASNDNLSYAGIKLYLNNFDRDTNYVTLVDTGNFSGGSEIAEKSKGKSSIEIMNAMGYDLVVPGTSEFDYGIATFLENMEALDATVICCNMLDIKNNSLAFLPYVIYEYGDTKIAYVGVTSPEVMYNDRNHDKFFDENGEQLYYFFEDETGETLYAQVQSAVDVAKEEGADKVVLLAHLGIEDVEPMWSSTTIIANTSGIDGVVDGHSMEILESGLSINKNGAVVPLVQAGSRLSNLGVMNITKDGYNFPAILSEKSIGKKDPDMQNLIDEVIKKYS